MARSSEGEDRGVKPSVPPEWRGAVFVAWFLLILAVLLLPIAGLLAALLGGALAANNVHRGLSRFLVVAGVVACVVGFAFRPVIDPQSGIDDPENAVPLKITPVK